MTDEMKTNEEKQLLLKDLCARLPYGVKVNYADEVYDVFGCSGNNLIIVLPFMSNLEGHPIETCKPYLRPMSSMTEEEKKEFQEIKLSYHFDEDGYILFDWLNKHHFDYRGLIEKGLALEAPEGMYNLK